MRAGVYIMHVGLILFLWKTVCSKIVLEETARYFSLKTS